MSLNLNDSDALFINIDIVFFFIFSIVLFSICKIYKRYNESAFTSGWKKSLYDNVIDDLYIPLILVTILRAVFFEGYFIPSGSMQPNLYAGDFVIVDKLAYGMKVPGTNHTLISNKDPKAGDIVVFIDPVIPRKMVKRLVALPGDKVSIRKDEIIINGIAHGEEFKHRGFDNIDVMGEKMTLEANFYEQNLGNNSFNIQRMPNIQHDYALDFEVPEGHYFVMGDNRENSHDSRAWGFVPERFVCGKAIGVILSVKKTNGVWTQERVGFLN